MDILFLVLICFTSFGAGLLIGAKLQHDHIMKQLNYPDEHEP